MGFLASLFLGFVPMFLFAAFVNWLDRYEKEPKILLGVIFVWGAVVAAGAAFLINTVLGLGLYVFTGSEGFSSFATGSLIAPVVEEILKGFAVLLVFLVFRREFDSILDGIVYAAIAAMGFAATENVHYIYSYGFQESGWEGLATLAFIRIILVGWQHPFYTAFFGIGLAMARLNRSLAIKIVAPLLGLIIGIIAHSIHNTMSPIFTSIAGFGGMIFGSFIDWIGWFMMFCFVIWMIAHERRLLIGQLKEEVELGILNSRQYAAATALFRPAFSRLASIFKGQFMNTRRFYQVCAELAHKKQQLVLLGDEEGNSAAIQKLRDELHNLSTVVAP
jgi:protease PrsW